MTNPVQRIIDEIDVSSFPLPLRLVATICDWSDGFLLQGVLHAPDIDTKQPSTVNMAQTISLAESKDREHVLCMARKLLHRLLAHELDEHLHVSGVRLFDPHAAEHGLRSPAPARTPPTR